MFTSEFFKYVIRILGLVDIYSSSCEGKNTDVRVLNLNKELKLDHMLHPISMIVCYFVLAVTSSVLLKPNVSVLGIKRI